MLGKTGLMFSFLQNLLPNLKIQEYSPDDLKSYLERINCSRTIVGIFLERSTSASKIILGGNADKVCLKCFL